MLLRNNDAQPKKPVIGQKSSSAGRKRLLDTREKLPSEQPARQKNRGKGSVRRSSLRSGLPKQPEKKPSASVERIEAAAHAARVAQEQAEAWAREERERQEKMRKELEAERERARVADEAARQAAIAAREEEERRRRAREEEMKRAREERAAAEEAARRAAEQARKAREEQEAVEKQLREGIQPVVMPTTAELKAAKEKIQYNDGVFHFAVAGVAGSGKSSLINALCGMSNQDPNAAPTGIVETTLEVGRYTNPSHADQFAWYDVPGSGTLKIPDWQYFNSQGLYVFDCVIVLFNNRFTMTDQAILTNCRRYRIPTFIVRSKADQHIRNLMKEMGYDSDDEGETKEGCTKLLANSSSPRRIGVSRRTCKRRNFLINESTLSLTRAYWGLFETRPRKGPSMSSSC
ncbi:interferon-inducible GTPase-domain-containing protein [Boletus reticuloceps]|uniref:Interferon-inducible GTPase-domain-containing protein n=1 Tax=Boletus reticuloceps TaxID=495285 RepID=A0A8I2YL39_9AGAM|nr:interferon-inducible GTPase-domain-containing protein [Boletus reticuloceps]